MSGIWVTSAGADHGGATQRNVRLEWADISSDFVSDFFQMLD